MARRRSRFTVSFPMVGPRSGFTPLLAPPMYPCACTTAIFFFPLSPTDAGETLAYSEAERSTGSSFPPGRGSASFISSQ